MENLNGTIENFTEGLYLNVVAVDVITSFAFNVLGKFLSNILWIVVTIFLLKSLQTVFVRNGQM